MTRRARLAIGAVLGAAAVGALLVVHATRPGPMVSRTALSSADVPFDCSRATLVYDTYAIVPTSADARVLDGVAGCLMTDGSRTVRIDGEGDDGPFALSEQQARIVAEALEARGVAPDRLDRVLWDGERRLCRPSYEECWLRGR